jgi:transglutaminase-like putative cysteine protease
MSTHAIIVTSLLTALASVAVAGPGEVVQTIDSPTTHPAGLATDGTRLFVADWREATIMAIDPAGEAPVSAWPAPTLRPHGMTFGEGLLWVSDDHTGGIYALDLDTGIVERTIQAPDDQATGLAWAGDSLFVLAGAHIYRVTTDDGTILACFEKPSRGSRCLAYDGDYLWVSDRLADEIYAVDPETGTVLGILNAPGPYAAGVAWHDDHLWNVDFQTDTIAKLQVRGETMYTLFDERIARAEYVWELANYGPGAVLDLTQAVAIPPELPSQRLLAEPRFKGPSRETRLDRWGQRCVVFNWDRVGAGQKAAVTMAVDARISAIRYLVLPDLVGSLDDIPEEISAAYTADDSRYRIDTPYMQALVEQIVGDEENPYWIARRIFDYVIDHLEYQMIGGWDVPEVVLKRGSGSCSEYTFAYVALCRAAGIPARYQGSLVVRGDDASIDEAFHRWAQVYLPGYGWIPVDANKGDKPSPADQTRGFGELANRFLITTQGGGGSELLHWGYNGHATYRTEGYANIAEDHMALFAPLDVDEAEPEQ